MYIQGCVNVFVLMNKTLMDKNYSKWKCKVNNETIDETNENKTHRYLVTENAPVSQTSVCISGIVWMEVTVNDPFAEKKEKKNY